MPFAESLGMTISRATRDEVRAEVCWDAQRCTVAGAMHGGVLMSLADSAGAVCAFLNLPEGATTSTIESKTNFMRGVREGSATATSRPLHVGRTTVVVQTEVRDDRGKLVSLTTQTQAVIT
ncbi:MAG: PaaI family thioesterase [Actinomycetota bacterium]|nr:PaaI family thioesterase [Actinomycetota bacterium]